MNDKEIASAEKCDYCGIDLMTYCYPAGRFHRLTLSGEDITMLDQRLEFCNPSCREIYLFYP